MAKIWKMFERKRHKYCMLVKAVGCKTQKLFTSGLLASVKYGMDIAGTATAVFNKLTAGAKGLPPIKNRASRLAK
eukprot:12924017-Prorocentrum_lima.AAC.1